MHMSTVIRPSDRAVYRKLAAGEGGVVLHLDSAAYHGLNEMGTVIWSRLEQGPAHVAALIEDLRGRLADAPAGWEQDVVDFLESLALRGLIDSEPGR